MGQQTHCEDDINDDGGDDSIGDSASVLVDFDPSLVATPRAHTPSQRRKNVVHMTKRQRTKAKQDTYVTEKLIANLLIMGELKVGDKLMMGAQGSFDIHQPTWLSSVTRLVKGVDRWKMFEHINCLVGQAESSIGNKRVEDALVNSLPGLENLLETYAADVAFTKRLGVVVDRVKEEYAAEDKNEVVFTDVYTNRF